MKSDYRVIVVGGGHAGVEAAWAAANLFSSRGFGSSSVALVTLDPARMGVMSCNPAIGGLAKGQLVREIDALGGLMGLAADHTGIQFKVLNTSKGPAVHGPRAQCDRHAYAEKVQELIASRIEIDVIAGSVERLIVESGRLRGLIIRTSGRDITINSHAVVLTTGTFMRGLMHRGEHKTEGGRHGEGAAVGISAALRSLGFELGRLKTGTPPRLRRASIDWDALELHAGDDRPVPFSDLTPHHAFPVLAQVDCRRTHTTRAIHDLIRANLHRAPMYSGQIESVGPRYCPSIEDKVVRFADRHEHAVVLEPESLRDDWIYCNGISTSLPEDVQIAIVRGMPGCEHASIHRYGYAVEYDMVRPHQIDATCMTRLVAGLFLAGQINGTSGYEEAAGQGIIAGINAARWALGSGNGFDDGPFILARHEAYIGVMIDDLITRTPVEPYRMFTSRAEHRLLLRADNAPDRLTPRAIEAGLLDGSDLGRERARLYRHRTAMLQRCDAEVARTRMNGDPLPIALRRPDFTPAHLARSLTGNYPDAVLATLHANYKYAAYVERERAQIRRRQEIEARPLPAAIDYHVFHELRTEAREALAKFRPATFGQAGRLEGVTPADLTLLAVLVQRSRAHSHAEP